MENKTIDIWVGPIPNKVVKQIKKEIREAFLVDKVKREVKDVEKKKNER